MPEEPTNPPQATQHNEPEETVDDLRRQLAQSQETITALERRQKIDQTLHEARTIDLEAARLLTEMTVSQMDEQDVSTAVSDLKRKRPYLFQQASAEPASMAPRLNASSSNETLTTTHAAAVARDSGHRQDLLRYLRLRRQP